MDNAKKPSAALIAGIVVLVLAIGMAAFFLLKGKTGGNVAENGSSNEPLPKEIVVESPDEARSAASDILGRAQSGTALSAAEYEQLRKEMQGT